MEIGRCLDVYSGAWGGVQHPRGVISCALDAGFEIVERHPHTRALPRTSGSFGKDATVAWNHIDLRFRPDDEFRIDAKLAHSKLVVRFGRGLGKRTRQSHATAAHALIRFGRNRQQALSG